MISELKSGTILYHGSYCEVRTPKLEKCRKYKDFGQGFYLTTDLEQAEKFSRLSLRKAIENGTASDDTQKSAVSCFEYTENELLKIKTYQTTDTDWLHCVVAHRKKNMFEKTLQELSDIDIFGGKIANNATNATILTYMAGTFGEPGTENTDNICIGLLIPERLKDQYCFRTQNALNSLKFRRGILL